MLDETEEKEKRFSKVEVTYKPPTNWWKDTLTEFTKGRHDRRWGEGHEGWDLQALDRVAMGLGLHFSSASLRGRGWS